MNIVSILSAFLAGFLSFFSPCVLPIIPSYLVFITGLSFYELATHSNGKQKNIIFLNSIFFILGFSFVFMLLGGLSGYFGSLVVEYKNYIRIIGGVIIIIFGLFILDVFPLQFLQIERKIKFDAKPIGLIGTFLVGAGFAAGWTPCVGPILGSILVLAASTQTFLSGMFLLSVYSIGFAIPFLLVALFLNSFMENLRKITNLLPVFTKFSGVILIILGLSLLLGFIKF